LVNRVALPIIREARSGNPAAQLALGRIYLEGRDGLRRDESTAYYWLQKAAANGDSEAARLIGAEISEASVTDPASAAPLYEQASMSGVTNASLTLADWILAGIVDRGSGTTAFDLILQAAEQGDRGAQLRLAMFYQHGDLVPQDERQAMYWFERAAEQGSPAAQMALADHLWRNGDPTVAKWLEALASRGDPETCFRYGSVLLADGRTRDGISWLQHAADHGHPGAQLAYGLLHATPRDGKVENVPHSYKKAAYWLEKASRQGLVQASYELSRLYALRSFSLRDSAMARRYLEKAAEQGHAHAQYLTGKAYWRLRVEPDADVVAVTWLLRAARQRHDAAARLLDTICAVPPVPSPNVLHLQLAAIRAAAKFNLALSTRFELAQAFGLERHEMLLLRPADADRGECLLIDVRTALRSARRRIVPILDASAREVLDRAIRLLDSGGPHPGDVQGNIRARQRVLDAALQKLGINWSIFAPHHAPGKAAQLTGRLEPFQRDFQSAPPRRASEWFFANEEPGHANRNLQALHNGTRQWLGFSS